MQRIMLIFLLSCVVCFGADQTIITVAGLIAAGAAAGDHTKDAHRPGQRKVYNQCIGNGTPVVKMTQITTVEL